MIRQQEEADVLTEEEIESFAGDIVDAFLDVVFIKAGLTDEASSEAGKAAMARLKGQRKRDEC